MTIRPEVLPFVGGVILVSGLLVLMLQMRADSAKRVAWICIPPAVVCIAYLLFFFRDPERHAPAVDRTPAGGGDRIGEFMYAGAVEVRTI